MKWLLCALGLAVIFIGCDTPYTGFLGAGDIDGYLESAGTDRVCLADGFDSICIQTIPGLPGKDGKNGRDGKNGKDGESIIGPRGARGPEGEPGRDGAVVYLELEKIVTEIETVEVPVIEKEIFVLQVLTDGGDVPHADRCSLRSREFTSCRTIGRPNNTYSTVSGRTQAREPQRRRSQRDLACDVSC